MDSVRYLHQQLDQKEEELQASQHQLLLTEKALEASSKADPFYVEPPEMEAYRDTIRILKDGIFGYEELMREQQEFVDTLLNHLSESSVNDLKKKSRNARLGRYTTLEDSLSYYKKITVQQLAKLAAQDEQLMRMQKTQPSTSPPVKSPVAGDLKVLRENLEQASQENLRLLNALDVQEKKYAAMLADIEVADKKKLGSLKGLEERYKGQILALNRQVINQAKRTQQLEAELEVRLSLQADLQTKLMVKQEEMAKKVARTSSQVKEFRGSNKQLKRQIHLLEDQLRESEDQAEYARKQAHKINTELAFTRTSLLDKAEELDALQNQMAESRASQLQAEVAKNRFKLEAEASQVLADSVINLNQAHRWRAHRLNVTIDSLHGEIALLDPYSESAKARRRVYQQQLENLTRLRKQLPQLEKSLYAREKLLDQREKYLREFGNNSTFASLLDQLDEALAQNATYEQKLAESVPDFELAKGEIYTSDTKREAQMVTAFCMDNKQAGLVLRGKILNYFRDNKIGKMADEPLTFEPFLNTEISNLPITLSFDISEEVSTGWRRVACTVRLSNGLYLEPAASVNSRKVLSDLLTEIIEK